MSSKRKYRLFFLLSCLFLKSLLAVGVEKDDLKKIRISRVKYEGSGCPKGSVLSLISPDKEVFTLSFSEFVVSKNGASDPRKVSKDCRVSITLKKPKHMAFKFFSLAFEGASILESHLKGALDVVVRSRSSTDERPKRKLELQGPFNDNYELTEDFDLQSYPWKDCNRTETNLTFHSKITVAPFPEKKNSQSGFLSTDFMEGKVKEKIGLLWKDCRLPKKRESSLAFCKVFLKDKKGKVVKKFIKKEFSKNLSKALKKAKEKARRHCEKLDRSDRDHSCSPSDIKCETKELS